MPSDDALAPLKVKRLSSGYWYVRVNSTQHVQWPTGRPPTQDDVFHGPLSHTNWLRLEQVVADAQ